MVASPSIPMAWSRASLEAPLSPRSLSTAFHELLAFTELEENRPTSLREAHRHSLLLGHVPSHPDFSGGWGGAEQPVGMGHLDLPTSF